MIAFLKFLSLRYIRFSVDSYVVIVYICCFTHPWVINPELFLGYVSDFLT